MSVILGPILNGLDTLGKVELLSLEPQIWYP